MIAAIVLAAASTPCAAQTSGYSRAAVRSDKQFATYAFAHEFGSGVYDFSGRTLQVYSLPIGWDVRDLGPLSKARALEHGVVDWIRKSQG